MPTWFGDLWRVFAKPQTARPIHRCRLCVEAFEDRFLLAAGYLQTNLISDIPGVAQQTDPNLVNPWGMALSPTGGTIWISDNGATPGVTTLYTGDVKGSPVSINQLVVTIPGDSPTG